MPRTLIRLFTLIAVLIVLAILWRYLVSTGILTVDRLVSWVSRLDAVRTSHWVIPGIAVVYVISLLLAFPLTVLVVLTGIVFGPWWGLLYAAVGTLSSSVVTFWIGHFIGREALERHGGRHLNAMSSYMGQRGIRTMVLINLLPLAPFTFTNLMAGAFNMHFGRYLLGSTIGILPGLTFVTVLGGQASRIVRAENREEFLLAIAIFVIVAIMFATAMILLRRYRRDTPS